MDDSKRSEINAKWQAKIDEVYARCDDEVEVLWKKWIAELNEGVEENDKR